MNTLIILACLLAAAVAKPIDDDIIPKYLEQLLPYINACGEEQKLSDEELLNVQQVGSKIDVTKLACLRSCVMRQMGALQGNEVILTPINELIEKVHTGKDDEIATMKKIASECSVEVVSETDNCQIGMKYTECYIEKMFT